MSDSVEELIVRIKTYAFAKWPFIYSSINPYKCAKLGYICVDNNTLECCFCKAKVILECEYEKLNDIELSKLFAKDFYGKLEASHINCKYEDMVLMRNSSLKKSYFIDNIEEIYHSHLKSYKEAPKFLQKENFLPKIDYKILELIVNDNLISRTNS